jgi:hypothetical protein
LVVLVKVAGGIAGIAGIFGVKKPIIISPGVLRNRSRLLFVQPFFVLGNH